MLPITLAVAALTHGLMADYRYLPMPGRVVAIETADHFILGTLTPEGVFKEKSRRTLPKGEETLISSGPIPTLLNPVIVTSEPMVYELRGEKLVPGKLSWDGEFTPNPKKETILFRDYVYTSTSPFIWNLPGKFTPLGVDPDRFVEMDPKRAEALLKASGGGGMGGFGGMQFSRPGFSGDGTWRDGFAQVQNGTSTIGGFGGGGMGGRGTGGGRGGR